MATTSDVGLAGQMAKLRHDLFAAWGGAEVVEAARAAAPRRGDVLEVQGRDGRWTPVGLTLRTRFQAKVAAGLLGQSVGSYRLRRDGVIVATN